MLWQVCGCVYVCRAYLWPRDRQARVSCQVKRNLIAYFQEQTRKNQFWFCYRRVVDPGFISPGRIDLSEAVLVVFGNYRSLFTDDNDMCIEE